MDSNSFYAQNPWNSPGYQSKNKPLKKLKPTEQNLADIIEKVANFREYSPKEASELFPNLVFVEPTDQKWHDRWFNRAREVSLWSKDPSTKVGAVFVNEETHRELSAGYNGFPRGIKDDDRLNNREMKYKLVVHAEQNGIYNAVNNGVILQGCSMYVWGLPICSDCAKGIIQVGVKKVYVKKEFVEVERWRESWLMTRLMFEEAGVKIIIM